MEARNELEEFVIKMEKKIDSTDISNFVTDQYQQKLRHVESWLNEKGDSESKETLMKLKTQLEKFDVLKTAEAVKKIQQSLRQFVSSVEEVTGLEIGCQYDDAL